MTSRTASALRKSTSPRKTNSRKAASSKADKLPEWNLSDLYSAIDAPEVTHDLDRLDSECVAFENDYKGMLAERTAGEGGGGWLAGAVKRYEAIDDLAGRLSSYAGLVHAGDSVDPVISKFYGDVSERLTNASVHLLFFALELNRIDDAVIENAMSTAELVALSAVDRGFAQGQALSTRRPRRAIVSRKIPERIRRLEPAVRPDHLFVALQGVGQGACDRADAQSVAGPRWCEAQGGRRSFGQDLQGQ